MRCIEIKNQQHSDKCNIFLIESPSPDGAKIWLLYESLINLFDDLGISLNTPFWAIHTFSRTYLRWVKWGGYLWVTWNLLRNYNHNHCKSNELSIALKVYISCRYLLRERSIKIGKVLKKLLVWCCISARDPPKPLPKATPKITIM